MNTLTINSQANRDFHASSLKVNLHILENCNYRCKHCFAHFESSSVLKIDAWKNIVNNCIRDSKIMNFNIAGGEPLLYSELGNLIRYIHESGSKISIISNGYRMTDEWIMNNAIYFDTIGLSIDSANEDTLIEMGRCTRKGEFLSNERLQEICALIKIYNPNCKIKINTVVSSLNKSENMGNFISSLPVSRWKIFKMQYFSNSTFNNKDLLVSDNEYMEFIKNNLPNYKESGMDVSTFVPMGNGGLAVVENNLKAGYIMVDANGHLVDDTLNDSYTKVIDCQTESFADGLNKLNFDKDLFYSRYELAPQNGSQKIDFTFLQ